MAPLVNGTRRVLTNAPPAVPAKEAAAIERGPLTRRQHSLARTRRENETRSLLLQLHDDVLERILGFLEGRDLAVLECACTHFRYGSFVPANKEALARDVREEKAGGDGARGRRPRGSGATAPRNNTRWVSRLGATLAASARPRCR